VSEIFRPKIIKILMMFLQVMINNVMFFHNFLRISTHTLLGLHSLGSAEANIG